MNLETDILREIDQTDLYHKTNIIWYGLHMESKIMLLMSLFKKQKSSHRCRKTHGGGKGGINWQTEIDIYTLLYIK